MNQENFSDSERKIFKSGSYLGIETKLQFFCYKNSSVTRLLRIRIRHHGNFKFWQNFNRTG
ncbi:hypothetical protein ACOI3B_11450, partial [Acinetobacter baumannii]